MPKHSDVAQRPTAGGTEIGPTQRAHDAAYHGATERDGQLSGCPLPHVLDRGSVPQPTASRLHPARIQSVRDVTQGRGAGFPNLMDTRVGSGLPNVVVIKPSLMSTTPNSISPRLTYVKGAVADLTPMKLQARNERNTHPSALSLFCARRRPPRKAFHPAPPLLPCVSVCATGV
jgi:hypothetical protein